VGTTHQEQNASSADAPTHDKSAAFVHVESPHEAHHHGHHFPIELKFMEQLKRRNVGRVGLLYIAVAYVVLEVFELFFHLLEMPTWAGRAAVILAIIGFPVALVIAWAYEITPEGLKPTDEVPPDNSIRVQTGRRLDLAIIVMLSIALGYFVVDKFWLSKHMQTDPEPANSSAHPEAPAAASVPTVAMPAPAAAPDKSIAVLPFVDMSEKNDNQYFSDGLTEELINQLAQLPELKVIARTSSFQFRNGNEDIRSIAGKLGVANLLEGSVRKVAKKLRITVQLIRAADGVHLWSSAYDRDEIDIFKVQTEIATTVASSLKVSLETSAIPGRAGTNNLEAYNWYLQGVLIDRQARDRADFLKAIEYLRKALQGDPTYAEAFAALANTLAEQAEWGLGPAAALTDEARSAAMRAVELNPRIPETHTALAKVLIMNDWNFKSGQDELEKAMQIDPNHPLALTLAGQLAMYRGKLDASVELRNKSILYDPANPWRYLDLAITLYYQHRYVESQAAYRHMQDLNPSFPEDHIWVGTVLLAMGDPAAAIVEMDRETKDDTRSASGSRVLAYDALGKKSDADSALSLLETKHARDAAYEIGRVYANRHELDHAFQWFDKAYRQHDDGLTTIKVDPLLKNVQTDPRFRTLVQKLTLLD